MSSIDNFHLNPTESMWIYNLWQELIEMQHFIQCQHFQFNETNNYADTSPYAKVAYVAFDG